MTATKKFPGPIPLASWLSVAGLLLASFLSWAALTGVAPAAGGNPLASAGTTSVCVFGSSCASVWNSAYGRLLGLPVALWGAATYALLAAGGWWRMRHPDHPAAVWGTVGLSAAGAVFSLYLVGVQALLLRSFCLWCALSAGLMLLISGLYGLSLSGGMQGSLPRLAGAVLGVMLAAASVAGASRVTIPVSVSSEPPLPARGAMVRTLAQLDQLMTAGDPRAPVLVEMYSDFQCPYCAQAARTVLQPLLAKEVAEGKVRVGYRHFAFIGRESKEAARAASCAAVQGRFWAYHDALFAAQRGENTGAFRRDRLLELASQVGLDTQQFAACLADRRTNDLVEQSYERGRRLGVQATPTFFVNGRKYEGVVPLETIRRLISGQ